MKINTLFDNKNYNINESYLTSAEANFKAYLLNNMGGNGATLYFKDQLYNIDSSKLNAATNKLVQSFSSISGEGYKVSVNGTEYAISSSKLEEATNNMHDFLSKISGDGEIVKNQYGFYYNVPYVANVQSHGLAIVLYENGKCAQFSDFEYRNCYPDDLTYSDYNELSCLAIGSYTYNEADNSVSAAAETGVFSEDGLSLVVSDITYVADTTIVPHGAYYNEEYICTAADNQLVKLVCNEDGTLTMYEDNGDIQPVTVITWDNEYSGVFGEIFNFAFSLDGKIMYVYNRNISDNIVVLKMQPKSDENECPIHFGEIYVANTIMDGQDKPNEYIFNEDGSVKTFLYSNGGVEEVDFPTGYVTYVGNEMFNNIGVLFATVNEDGTIITNPDGTHLTLKVTSDILDNEFPIQFNSLDVVNNTPFSIEGVQLVRVSDNTVTDEELSSFVVTVNMSGMTIPLSCGGVDNEGDYSLAVYKVPDESMAAFIACVNTPFEHNGAMLKTGLYVTNVALPLYYETNADITIEKVVS